ncbi:MAG: hypothetical protein AVDCRST_MAG02-271, partial [uncultured Rubrobacteraceae bacterium]
GLLGITCGPAAQGRRDRLPHPRQGELLNL